jgi:hypothetical protein
MLNILEKNQVHKIEEMFPEISDSLKIQSIWKNFYKIDRLINKNEITAKELEEETKIWHGLFIQVYKTL